MSGILVSQHKPLTWSIIYSSRIRELGWWLYTRSHRGHGEPTLRASFDPRVARMKPPRDRERRRSSSRDAGIDTVRYTWRPAFDRLIAASWAPLGGNDDGQHLELGQIQQAHHTGVADGGSGGCVFPVARHLHRRRGGLSDGRRSR